MPGLEGLINPQGIPIIKEPKLLIIKAPKEVHIPQKLVEAFSKMSGCNVAILPMDFEVAMGNLALREVESLHFATQAILGLPPISLTVGELSILHKAMQYLCLKTTPKPESAEAILTAKIAKVLK